LTTLRNEKHSMSAALSCAFLLLAAGTQAATEPGPTDESLVLDSGWGDGGKVAFWLQSSLKRVYPKSPAGSAGTMKLLAARNSRVSFEACLQNRETHFLAAKCRVTGPGDVQIQVRKVGYVPLWKVTAETPVSDLEGLEYSPGLVPDPLYPEPQEWIGPYENQAFWITLTIPPETKPGLKKLQIHFDFGKSYAETTQHAKLNAEVEVSPFTIKPRHDFPVTHWWRADSLYDYYKTEPFDERWWQLAKPYIANLVAHGNDTIYVPVFTVYLELRQRPPQLLLVTEPKPGVYEFDFSRVKRFLDMAKGCGATHFEWSHFWCYGGVRYPTRVYTTENGALKLLWPKDTEATSEVYRNFLRQFLPVFKDFLTREGVLERSFFHLSDEPNGQEDIERYRKARALLREYAPWMKVMDALSDVQYARQGLTDMPIPQVQEAPAFLKAGVPHWVYYCLAPLGPHLNRFLDTPLPKLRMGGFLFYRLQARGFLHWGYNYWMVLGGEQLIDPFTEAAGGHQVSYGDPFVVYPGKDGPIDSIRWETFAESLQDYAILQTAGIDPSDPRLEPIKSYGDFPKNEQWIKDTLRSILLPDKPGDAGTSGNSTPLK
jgi:hypothetical protein